MITPCEGCGAFREKDHDPRCECCQYCSRRVIRGTRHTAPVCDLPCEGGTRYVEDHVVHGPDCPRCTPYPKPRDPLPSGRGHLGPGEVEVGGPLGVPAGDAPPLVPAERMRAYMELVRTAFLNSFAFIQEHVSKEETVDYLDATMADIAGYLEHVLEGKPLRKYKRKEPEDAGADERGVPASGLPGSVPEV